MAEDESSEQTEEAPRRKAPARKTAATKAPARKAPAKKASSEGTGPRRSSRSEQQPRRVGAREVADAAARQLMELTGREPEGVTGLERTDDGWNVSVEVLELRRVPATTDVLAVYEVQVDDRGDLQGYRRVQRYARGDAGGER